MEVDFDKQIDMILQDLAKRNTFVETLPKSHLDADELSAFAENALPAKTRLRTMEHLADCSRCRKILTKLVSFNVEAESETIHEEVKTIAIIPVIPWYRRLLAFPQLAYTMGALALVLSGMVGYLVLQNSRDSQNTVAQMDKSSDHPTATVGASSEGDAPIKETYSNSANTASNVAQPAANTVANASAPTSTPNVGSTDSVSEPQATPVPITNAPTVAGPTPTEKLADDESPSDLKTNKDVAKEEVERKKDADTKAGEAQKPKVTNEQPQSEVGETNVSRQQQEPTVQNRSQNVMMPDGQNSGKNVQQAPVSPKKAENRREGERDRTDDTSQYKNKKAPGEDKPSDTRSIGGKTFRNANGIWTDSSYPGGSTKNVKRGTDDYKKLDSGLQNIGNTLSGTVIVVWGGKNYKIQ